jgi:hypothetical protein
MFISLRELLCRNVFGGHIIPPPLHLGWNEKSTQNEFAMRCVRCGRESLIDGNELNKIFGRKLLTDQREGDTASDGK